MLTVAIDESGTHAGSPVLCVAVCLGMEDHWARFREAWLPYARVFERAGGYHATAASEFANATLADLICEHLPIPGFALRMAYADMKELVPHELRSHFGEEYAIAVILALKVVDAWCTAEERKGREGHDWVSYVLEDGHKGAARVKQEFARIKGRSPDNPNRLRVYSDTWVGKEELITHPPDLVSHVFASCYGEAEEPAIVKQMRAHRWSLKDYTRDALMEAVQVNTDLLRQIRHERDKERRERKRRQRGQL